MPDDTESEQSDGISLRERKKRATRRSIARAALELIADRGYEATTVDMIAERAGVSTPTFFRYFSSKDEVLRPGAARNHAMVRQSILSEPKEQEPFWVAWRAVRTAILDDFDAETAILRQKAVRSHPTVSGTEMRTRSAWEHVIADALDEWKGASTVRGDSRLTARIVMTLVVHSTARWMEGGAKTDYEMALDDTFQEFLRQYPGSTSKRPPGAQAQARRPRGVDATGRTRGRR